MHAAFTLAIAAIAMGSWMKLTKYRENSTLLVILDSCSELCDLGCHIYLPSL